VGLDEFRAVTLACKFAGDWPASEPCNVQQLIRETRSWTRSMAGVTSEEEN
jgi:hypothetical protein